MSMISEQVNALKDLAELQNIPYHKRIIKRAADTIESLDCGRWIHCKEKLPEEYGAYLVAWKPLYMTKDQMIELVGRVVPHFYEIVEYDPDDDKKWIGDIKQAHGQYEIIAWQPLPEPYYEP